MRRLSQLQALRHETEPPRRLREAVQVLDVEGRYGLRQTQCVIRHVVPMHAQRRPRLLEQRLRVVG